MEVIENNFRHSFCPLCQSDLINFQGTVKYDTPTYYSTIKIRLSNIPELWKCERCKSSFIQNIITEQDAIRLYSHGSSEERWTSLPFEQIKTNAIISKLKPHLEKGVKVLDIGCGSGSLLDFAKARGCQTYGVEYSISSLTNILENGHIGFSSLSKVDTIFDIITAFDVIEHLYDFSSFLNICKTKIASGGCLIFLTGDISCNSARVSKSDWWYVSYPEHILFPSKTYFINYSGLEVVDWVSTYHSKYDQDRSTLKALKKFVKENLLMKTFNGSPSPDPDHALIILRRHNQE
jgi:2-polyprenyl-3-methyl-5-hydroxy-6-metoxy-1,4-benzoquinol methylase